MMQYGAPRNLNSSLEHSQYPSTSNNPITATTMMSSLLQSQFPNNLSAQQLFGTGFGQQPQLTPGTSGPPTVFPPFAGGVGGAPPQLPTGGRDLHTQQWVLQNLRGLQQQSNYSRDQSMVSVMSDQSIPDDVASRISGMSRSQYGLSLSMSSLNGGPMPPHVGFASPIGSSTENLDPKTDRRHNTIKRQPQNQRPLPADYNKYMRELMEMIGDKDLEVANRCLSTMMKMAASFRVEEPIFGELKEKILSLLITEQSQNVEFCGACVQFLLLLLDGCSFRKLSNDHVRVVQTMCKLVAREERRQLGLERLLPFVYQVVGPRQPPEPARQQLIKQLRLSENVVVFVMETLLDAAASQPVTALDDVENPAALAATKLLRLLILDEPQMKAYVTTKCNAVEVLVRLSGHPTLRLAALRSLTCLITSSDRAGSTQHGGLIAGDEFLRIGGIQAITSTICAETTSDYETLMSQLSCLCTASSSDVVRTLDLNDSIGGALAVMKRLYDENAPRHSSIDSSTKRMALIRQCVWYISNVAVQNTKAKEYLTVTTTAFEELAFVGHQFMSYLLVSGRKRKGGEGGSAGESDAERAKRQEYALSVVERCVTALTVLNKTTNPLRQRASQLIDESLNLRQLFLNLFSFFGRRREAERVIRCWHRMYMCDYVPQHPQLPEMLLSFIAGLAERGPPLCSSVAVDMLCLHVKTINCPDKIVQVFRENKVDLFGVLGRCGDDGPLCIALLHLVETLCARDPLLRNEWAQNLNVRQAVNNYCQNISDPAVREQATKVNSLFDNSDEGDCGLLYGLHNLRDMDDPAYGNASSDYTHR